MLEHIIEVTQSAGRLIEEIRQKGFDVHQKGHQGPVTEADHAADSFLKRELLSLEDCGWLSEETADDRSRLDQRRLWVVDPLDGTKEFVRGLPEYTVAVALVDGGRPVLGVVHNPANGDTFWAKRGGGAFKNGEAVHVAEGTLLLASRSEIKRGEFAPFMKRDWEITHCGSIEYKLALIASGAGAATLSRGPKWEWDVCAGAVIVEEAGGLATDVFGNPLAFNQSFPKVRGILAGAPASYRRALAEVAAMGASDRMNEFADVTDRGEP